MDLPICNLLLLVVSQSVCDDFYLRVFLDGFITFSQSGLYNEDPHGESNGDGDFHFDAFLSDFALRVIFVEIRRCI